MDIDLGEMFLNFPLPKVLRSVSGIDLSPMFLDLMNSIGLECEEKKLRRFWVYWTRCWMGSKPSPYFAIRFYYLAEEFARGFHADPKNHLRWDVVKLNLPGDPSFDPTRPRVMKWDSSSQKIAGDILAFVDDLRASGATLEEAWQVARQVASRLQYLGIQDAPRKRRPSSLTPGAWAGAILATEGGKVSKSVTKEKWSKAKLMIQELLDEITSDPLALLSFKRLEQVRGFLCHLAMTFEIMFPYLKGFHLTLASHLGGRDGSGRKLPSKGKKRDNKIFDVKTKEDLNHLLEVREYLEEHLLYDEESKAEWSAFVLARKHSGDRDSSLCYSRKDSPDLIKPVPMLRVSLESLSQLFSSQDPPSIDVRANCMYTLLFGFADASGTGLGSTVMGTDGIRHRIGVWNSELDGESSNFREFENCVGALEEEGKQGRLSHALVFLCTDNLTTESALYKGNSSSVKLFQLVLRLRKLEIRYSARISVSHVSGERMKAQGTDGVSRGHLKEGVTAGMSMLSFIPFDVSALDRSPVLKPWLEYWMGNHLEFLEPEDWFVRGHDHSVSPEKGTGGQWDDKGFWRPTLMHGTFVWSPPPAAALVALEELRKARIKRQRSTHFFIVPRLLVPEWRRQLHKSADLILEVPPGSDGWPTKMYEPLIIACFFPFLRHAPWQLRGTPKMCYLARTVRKMFQEKDLAQGDFLRKLLLECRRLPSLSRDVLWRVLYFSGAAKVSRPPTGGRRCGRSDHGEGKVDQALVEEK